MRPTRIAAAPAKAPSPRATTRNRTRRAPRDARWAALTAELAALRERHRHSVRIVDADCGAGDLLLCALSHARALGFTAVEGRGIDGSKALITRAVRAARTLHDPGIGVTFEVADLAAALTEETDLPADIVLWHDWTGGADHPAFADVVVAAGRRVIDDATGAEAAA